MSEEKKAVPKWATAPFNELIDDLDHLDQLHRMSMQGISVIQGMPKVVSALARADGTSDDEKTAK